jgi:hypothetical protein
MASAAHVRFGIAFVVPCGCWCVVLQASGQGLLGWVPGVGGVTVPCA